MHSYSLLAPAKINLYLEILGDRPDGYHELAMVLQSISLADHIELRANGTDQFRLHCDHPQVPLDATNLAYRAADLLTREFPDAFNQFGGMDITIQKRIPVGAGLAGGSTNAAAVLVGIDLMWKLGLTQSELQEFGAQLGSDIPFCISGGTAIATGRGERLAPLPSLDQLYVVLAKYRNLSVSTPWAYQSYRKHHSDRYSTNSTQLEGRRKAVHSGPLVAAIAAKNNQQIGQLLFNDLERAVLPEHPQVAELRDKMQQISSLGAMMSGSGPTVFALANSRAEAETIQANIQELLPHPNLDTWVAQFCVGGIQITPT